MRTTKEKDGTASKGPVSKGDADLMNSSYQVTCTLPFQDVEKIKTNFEDGTDLRQNGFMKIETSPDWDDENLDGQKNKI